MCIIPSSTSGQFLKFDDPIDIVAATAASSVPTAIKAAEEFARQNRWVIGYVSYDAASAFEPAIPVRTSHQYPLVWFGVFNEPKLVSLAELTQNTDRFKISDTSRTDTAHDFKKLVAGITAKIQEGEVYQVNLTTRVRGRLAGDPVSLFAHLYNAQPSPYSCFINTPLASVCCVSPELFFSLSDGVISTKPMKGTLAVASSNLETGRAALLSDEKELAENTMICDMARNDLSRIADGNDLMCDMWNVETWPTVHQLTSEVTTKTTRSLVEIFSALFPAASVTGAPKIAACNLIDTLETSARGLYTGAVGVIRPGGEAQFAVGIRTAVINPQGDLEYGTGSGITIDSDADSEWTEALTKTRVLTDSGNVFETMRYRPDKGLCLTNQHLERLTAGALHRGFPVLDLDDLVSGADTQYKNTGEQIVRVEISDTGAQWSARPFGLEGDEHTVAVYPHALSACGVGEVQHKSTLRFLYDLAADHAESIGVFDCVMIDSKNHVIESSRSNIVIRKHGRYLTPPGKCGPLAGTLRHRLIKRRIVREAILTVQDLTESDHVYLINSVRGWVKVRYVGN